MKDQHTKISGYRDLNEAEIAAMNEIKAKAEEIRVLIHSLGNRPALEMSIRWQQIAQDHLQQGFMALVRSIAKPTTF